MGYIDVHCHLSGLEIRLEEVAPRWREANVERVICSGFDLESSLIAFAYADENEDIYCTAGYHPSEIGTISEDAFALLRKICEQDKCVGVGEFGLDYHYENNPPKQEQKEAFIRQLVMANELKLPVIIHSRDAAQDTLDILREHKSLLSQGGLLHCYSYSAELVEPFLDLGFYFSFGGPCTYKNANKVVDSVKRIPLDRLLSETDCPYLTPVPKRGEFPNEPQNVVFVAKRLAELKGVEVEAFNEQVNKNARALFKKLK